VKIEAIRRRYLSFLLGSIALLVVAALSTDVGAAAFLSPGIAVSEALFPNTPGSHVSLGAASPGQAIMEVAVHQASDSYIHSLWCAIAFWIALVLVLAVVGHRIQRRSPERSLERTGGK
jgi:hypothetical protein